MQRRKRERAAAPEGGARIESATLENGELLLVDQFPQDVLVLDAEDVRAFDVGLVMLVQNLNRRNLHDVHIIELLQDAAEVVLKLLVGKVDVYLLELRVEGARRPVLEVNRPSFDEGAVRQSSSLDPRQRTHPLSKEAGVAQRASSSPLAETGANGSHGCRTGQMRKERRRPDYIL